MYYIFRFQYSAVLLCTCDSILNLVEQYPIFNFAIFFIIWIKMFSYGYFDLQLYETAPCKNLEEL